MLSAVKRLGRIPRWSCQNHYTQANNTGATRLPRNITHPIQFDGSIAWVVYGGPIPYDGREVYRIAVSNAIGPPLTLPGLRPIHIRPQPGDIEYNT